MRRSAWSARPLTFTATGLDPDHLPQRLERHLLGAAIDNVSVTAPEPSTPGAMLIMGFGGVGAVLRARRRDAFAL